MILGKRGKTKSSPPIADIDTDSPPESRLSANDQYDKQQQYLRQHHEHDDHSRQRQEAQHEPQPDRHDQHMTPTVTKTPPRNPFARPPPNRQLPRQTHSSPGLETHRGLQRSSDTDESSNVAHFQVGGRTRIVKKRTQGRSLDMDTDIENQPETIHYRDNVTGRKIPRLTRDERKQEVDELGDERMMPIGQEKEKNDNRSSNNCKGKEKETEPEKRKDVDMKNGKGKEAEAKSNDVGEVMVVEESFDPTAAGSPLLHGSWKRLMRCRSSSSIRRLSSSTSGIRFRRRSYRFFKVSALLVVLQQHFGKLTDSDFSRTMIANTSVA